MACSVPNGNVASSLPSANMPSSVPNGKVFCVFPKIMMLAASFSMPL